MKLSIKPHKKASELKVITTSKKMFQYIITITEKSPKKFRYTFVLKLHNLCMDLMENLYFANETKIRRFKKESISTKLFCDLKIN